MATLTDIAVSGAINILTTFVFFLVFTVLRIQPVNDRVYFPKWYLKGLRCPPLWGGAFASKFVNLDFRAYRRFLNWMPDALQMPEPEVIDHAGLDSAVYLRIYLLGWKVFSPIALTAFTTSGSFRLSNLTYSNIDMLSISNIPTGSSRFWTHLIMAYAFSFWTCYCLKKEYATVARMRLHFLASENRCPDQFTVLVRNVPPDPDESVSELVEHFFLVNHHDHYLTPQIEKDREEAMDPGTLGFNTGEPQIQLYFLLGLVYAVVTPILLPFILVFFSLAYTVYRHQIINVYNQEYESAAAFWPDVHRRIVTALVVSQIIIMGLLSTKEASQSTPLLITLPVLTISFHKYCKECYEPAFRRYPLQEAMMKDTLDKANLTELQSKIVPLDCVHSSGLQRRTRNRQKLFEGRTRRGARVGTN